MKKEGPDLSLLRVLCWLSLGLSIRARIVMAFAVALFGIAALGSWASSVVPQEEVVSFLVVTALLGTGVLLLAIGTVIVVTQPIRGLHRAAEKLAEGDFEAEIPEGADDELGGLADALRRIGTYERLTAEQAEAMSRGDLTRPPHARSKNDALGSALAGSAEMQRTVLDEIGRVLRGVAAGDLTVKAEGTGCSGTHASVLDAVNAIVEAYSRPMGEAMEVLEAVSRGELSQRMSGGYEGVYAQVALGLNATIDRLEQSLRDIDEGARQVAMNASAIADESRNLTQTTQRQEIALADASQHARSLIDRYRVTVEASSEASELANYVHERSQAGVEGMASLEEALRQMRAAAQSTSRIVAEIDDIAFRTNLLALNASVEAARAGEAGSGFAVVASEVRALALKSAASAKSTAKTLEDAQASIESSTALGSRMREGFEEIAKGIHAVSDLLEKRTSSDETHAKLYEEIARLVSEASRATREAAQCAERSETEISDLANETRSMKALVQTFSFRDGSGTAHRRDPVGPQREKS